MTGRGTSSDSGPVRVDTVVSDVLEHHGVRQQVERLGVLDLWSEIVGDQIANVTNAKGLDDATLFVEVRSSAWLMELNLMKGEFLERVNERMSDVPIDRIVFVLAETE